MDGRFDTVTCAHYQLFPPTALRAQVFLEPAQALLQLLERYGAMHQKQKLARGKAFVARNYRVHRLSVRKWVG